jgi:hypothetical protein
MPIFIVGCGRSGTHWLGKIITSCSQIAGTVTDVTTTKNSEILSIRQLCEKGIYYPSTLDQILPSIYVKYNKYIKKYFPKIYADKTHGELWIIDSLSYMFQNAKFIGIERAAYPVISSLVFRNSSMSKRRADLHWKKYPIPTGPSGITSKIAKCYNRFDIFERAALVWLAHKIKMKWAKKILKNKLLILSYESMLKNFISNIKTISKFIDTKILISQKIMPKLNENTKWKYEIPKKSVDKIKCLLNNKDIINSLEEIVTIHARNAVQIRRSIAIH